jgi:hypothetical protein
MVGSYRLDVGRRYALSAGVGTRGANQGGPASGEAGPP